jgi:hypothetical protein
MSQATHSLPARRPLSAHPIVGVSALLALLATAAVVVALAIAGGSTQTSAPAGQSIHPAFRWTAPEESATAPSPTGVNSQARPTPYPGRF